MNRTIRRISLAFLVLFLALLVNVNYIQAIDADNLNSSSANRRVLLDQYSKQRGSIRVGGQEIASSKKTDDELQYLRQYKEPHLYGQITGYYSSIYGSNFIELQDNDILAGTDDSLFVRRVIDMVTNTPLRGGNVQLTLNADAQQAAYDGLGDQVGAVAAIDPQTGAVLALASKPSYDPNKLASHDTEVQEKWWDTYTNDPTKPMNNRASQFTYPPGSTFKLITAAAALESGRYDPDTEVDAPSVLDLPLTDSELNNWQRGQCIPGQNSVTLTEALEESCNTAFANVGLDLGVDKLDQQATAFGFGTEFLPDIDGAASGFPADADEPQTALSSIGQYDVRATPLQMAMVAGAIANGGEVMEPYVVEQRTDANLSVLEETQPESVGQAVSSETADELKDMMISTVENGTAEPAKIDNIEVGGKTGTAQTTPDQPPYAWFVSFAPADNPQVAVAVVIEKTDVGRSEIAGGRLAAPIAKDVMEAVLGR